MDLPSGVVENRRTAGKQNNGQQQGEHPSDHLFSPVENLLIQRFLNLRQLADPCQQIA
jgi:hypothetical protein